MRPHAQAFPGRPILTDDRLYWLQDRRCYLCLRVISYSSNRRTKDHVWPRSRGGQFPGNKLLTHKACNQAKGDRKPWPCEIIYRDAVYLAAG